MNVLAQARPLPKVLTFGQAKYYIFSFLFVGLAVYVPWLTHQFHLAGPKFLPMHFFVLIAGFIFGWRTGLLVGVLSPLMSYSLIHQPIIAVLPGIMLELAVYGLAIGLLRERNLNIFVSLFSAMVLGRLARIVYIVVFSSAINPIQFIKISLPGIILQIILIPLAIYLLQKFVFDKRNEQ